MEKTNVMRILDQKKIKYNEYFYGDTNAISGVEVAKVFLFFSVIFPSIPG